MNSVSELILRIEQLRSYERDLALKQARAQVEWAGAKARIRLQNISDGTDLPVPPRPRICDPRITEMREELLKMLNSLDDVTTEVLDKYDASLNDLHMLLAALRTQA